MIRDTVTLFNQDGESQSGSGVFHRTTLIGVYCVVTRGMQGDSPANSLSLSIFDSKVLAVDADSKEKPYLEPEVWKLLTNKDEAWTLKGDETDYIVPGVTMAARPTQTAEAFRIISVRRCKAGNKRMWRWKVDAR
jgi:hypothetical protein